VTEQSNTPTRPETGLGHIPAPRLALGHITHRRHDGKPDRFKFRSAQWLVDIDALPAIQTGRRRLTIDPADHLYGTGLRTDLAIVLEREGIRLEPTNRVLMLANPQVNGYVFDPLTVFWCGDAVGGVQTVVLEVRNTYGGRHAYVLAGGGPKHTVEKTFYVSPFNDTHGHYQVDLSLTPQTVRVTVNLHRQDELVLAATVNARLFPLDSRTARAAGRHQWSTRWRVPLLIRWRGLLLAARGMRRHPRPAGGGNIRNDSVRK
jgi:DUF1365 family protein